MTQPATPPLTPEQATALDIAIDRGELLSCRAKCADLWAGFTELRAENESLLLSLASAREDGARLDWLALHHYDAVSLAVGKAYPTQPLRDAIDSALDAARSDSKEEPK